MSKLLRTIIVILAVVIPSALGKITADIIVPDISETTVIAESGTTAFVPETTTKVVETSTTKEASTTKASTTAKATTAMADTKETVLKTTVVKTTVPKTTKKSYFNKTTTTSPKTTAPKEICRYMDVSVVAKEMRNNPKMMGRIYIPYSGYTSKVFDCVGAPMNECQKRTDDKDSAAYVEKKTSTYCRTSYIGDHNYQGFDCIKSAKAGKSVLYFTDDKECVKYVCTEKYTGHRTPNSITDNNYQLVEYKTGFTLYTCNENDSNITITHWEAVN